MTNIDCNCPSFKMTDFEAAQQWKHLTNNFLIEASFCRYIAHESHIVSVYDYIHEL